VKHHWLHQLDPTGSGGRSVCSRCLVEQSWHHHHGAPFGGKCPGGWTINDSTTRVGDMPRRPAPTPSAKFIGGPLDGQTYWKRHGGRWSMYLDNEAQHLPPWRGDRVGRISDTAGCYIHLEERQEDGTSVHVYRHSTTRQSPTGDLHGGLVLPDST